MAREAIDVCLRMLKESNNRRFDSYSVRNSVLIISHITFRDCRVHINSCKHFVRSIRATRAREGFKLCAYLLSIYEYLVKQSISVVVLRAYALKKCITMRPATPKSYTSQLAEASHAERKKERNERELYRPLTLSFYVAAAQICRRNCSVFKIDFVFKVQWACHLRL